MNTIDHVRTRLAERKRVDFEGERRAAVLVPIIGDEGELSLLLTRRTEVVSTHRGQVAFPGGRVEPHDSGPEDTALREAEEEVALGRENVEVLGLLDDMPTVTMDTMVTPVVGRVMTMPELVPDPREVARIFSIPLKLLREKDRWEIKYMDTRGVRWPVYYFHYDGEMLWGLSAYITQLLLALTPEGAPFELPPPYGQTPLEKRSS